MCSSFDVKLVDTLAEALQANTTLSDLALTAVAFGESGACSLAELLNRNTTLSKLDLSGSGLGPSGATVLAGALMQPNASLRSLILLGTQQAAPSADFENTDHMTARMME